jgi:molybdenum cofactor cytidylyltransferase
MATLATVLLAAGCSSRFGPDNKLLAEIDGKPMVRLAAEAFVRSACFDDILVVTGHEASAVEQALAGLPVRFAFNADWEKGIGASIAQGIAQLPAAIDGAVVALGDMPFQSPDLVGRLVAVFDQHERQRIVFPAIASRRQRNPVIWPRSFFGRLQALPTQEGAKSLLNRHADACVAVPADNESVFLDIDERSTLQAVREPR